MKLFFTHKIRHLHSNGLESETRDFRAVIERLTTAINNQKEGLFLCVSITLTSFDPILRITISSLKTEIKHFRHFSACHLTVSRWVLYTTTKKKTLFELSFWGYTKNNIKTVNNLLSLYCRRLLGVVDNYHGTLYWS